MQDHHKLKGLWILIALTLVSALFMNVPTSPAYKEKTTDTDIIFRSIGSANNLLLDDTPTFSSPQLFKTGNVVRLVPGTYYWKTTGISLVSTFTIVSEVALAVEKQDDQYIIRNKGNVALDVAVKQRGIPVGFFIVARDDALPLALEESVEIIGVERDG